MDNPITDMESKPVMFFICFRCSKRTDIVYVLDYEERVCLDCWKARLNHETRSRLKTQYGTHKPNKGGRNNDNQ